MPPATVMLHMSPFRLNHPRQTYLLGKQICRLPMLQVPIYHPPIRLRQHLRIEELQHRMIQMQWLLQCLSQAKLQRRLP